MKCPKCNENNPNNAYYCHNCGKKLRTNVNAWMICFIVCAISAISMAVMAYLNNENAEYYRNSYCNANNIIQVKEAEINSLKSQLPQAYYTKYPEQYYYHICTDSFVKSDCYANQGTQLTVYRQSTTKGSSTLYGLTEFGWVPMDCLEKKW